MKGMKSNAYQNKMNKYKSEGLSYGGREKYYNLVELKSSFQEKIRKISVSSWF
jgi:hypothetical protein